MHLIQSWYVFSLRLHEGKEFFTSNDATGEILRKNEENHNFFAKKIKWRHEEDDPMVVCTCVGDVGDVGDVRDVRDEHRQNERFARKSSACQ